MSINLKLLQDMFYPLGLEPVKLGKRTASTFLSEFVSAHENNKPISIDKYQDAVVDNVIQSLFLGLELGAVLYSWYYFARKYPKTFKATRRYAVNTVYGKDQLSSANQGINTRFIEYRNIAPHWAAFFALVTNTNFVGLVSRETALNVEFDPLYEFLNVDSRTFDSYLMEFKRFDTDYKNPRLVKNSSHLDTPIFLNEKHEFIFRQDDAVPDLWDPNCTFKDADDFFKRKETATRKQTKSRASHRKSGV